MNNQKFIKKETEKIEVFILSIIENLWVGRCMLATIVVFSLYFILWDFSLGEYPNLVSVLCVGAFVNLLLLFSGNKRVRDIAIFFAIIVSACFIFIALFSSIFLVIIHKTAH